MLRSLSELAHQARGAFSLTQHDHSYRSWTRCLVILSRVSDTGPFIHQLCLNNCLSLPFCQKLSLPRPRGRTEHGHTCTFPWCNIRHSFISCLKHQILHISDWILHTCCYCSRHFSYKGRNKSLRAKGHLKLLELCTRWAYVTAT